jgi:hypothetical protein
MVGAFLNETLLRQRQLDLTRETLGRRKVGEVPLMAGPTTHDDDGKRNSLCGSSFNQLAELALVDATMLEVHSSSIARKCRHSEGDFPMHHSSYAPKTDEIWSA